MPTSRSGFDGVLEYERPRDWKCEAGRAVAHAASGARFTSKGLCGSCAKEARELPPPCALGPRGRAPASRNTCAALCSCAGPLAAACLTMDRHSGSGVSDHQVMCHVTLLGSTSHVRLKCKRGDDDKQKQPAMLQLITLGNHFFS